MKVGINKFDIYHTFPAINLQVINPQKLKNKLSNNKNW